jgi:hypothetical protein
MPLHCGPNPFRGSLRRQADATDAVSAYDMAEKLATEAVRSHVAAFVRTQSCPIDQSCPELRYDRDELRTSVQRVWGGPSPALPGYYRVVVQADYRFVISCDASPTPPPVDDPPPLPDTDSAPGELPWWLVRILEIACQHFCLFRGAGSDLGYCHVHITEASLFPDPGDRVTGVGHDDRTDPNDPHHTTVSRHGGCGFDTTTSSFGGGVPGPRDFGERWWIDIHFTALAPGEEVPEGWFRFECVCGTMAYTFIRTAFDVWYHNKHYPDLPPKKLRDELEKKLDPGG